jgi:hypothetical protein
MAEAYRMKSAIAIMILLLLAGSPAAAKCCSIGSGGSYNFLGDPAMDISMDSYDEFVRENAPTSAVPDVKTAAVSRLSLNLKNNSSISLLLTHSEGIFSGQGNMTSSNETLPVEAAGSLQADILSLDVTASGGVLHKFSLASEGSTVLGDYSGKMPDGEILAGVADGKWEG